MHLVQMIRTSFEQIQQGWVRLADRAFVEAAPADDMARGEFTSAFITEQDLTFPRAGDRRGRLRG